MSFNVSLNLGWFIQSYPQEVPLIEVSAPPVNSAIQVTLYPQWYKQVAIEWSVPVEFGACYFNVYFSPNGDSEWERLNATPITDTHFLDYTNKDYSIYQKGSYVVEAVLTSKGNVALRSTPVSYKNHRRHWVEIRAAEIQRREYFLLSHFSGIKSYLYKRKLYGDRCPRCWSVEAEKVVDDNCPVCFGTGFDGGYSSPIPLYLQYDPSPNDRQKSYMGNVEPNTIGAWTISIPDISDEDVIIRTGDWNTYKVTRVVPTELQGNTVRQQTVLSQLTRKDIENELMSRVPGGIGPGQLEDLGGKFVKERVPPGMLVPATPASPIFYQQDTPEQTPPKYRI